MTGMWVVVVGVVGVCVGFAIHRALVWWVAWEWERQLRDLERRLGED